VSLATDVHVRADPRQGADGVGRIGSELQVYPVVGAPSPPDALIIAGQRLRMPWLPLRLPSGREGWVYSAFLRLFDSAAEAEYFAHANQAARERYGQDAPYCLAPLPVAHDRCADTVVWRASRDGWERTGVLLRPDGTLRYVYQRYEQGERFISQIGEGRYVVEPLQGAAELIIQVGGAAPLTWDASACEPDCLHLTISLRELDAYLRPTSWRSRSFTTPVEDL